MSRQTTNYGLTKPDYTDTADIEVINSNMDIIDEALNDHRTEISDMKSTLNNAISDAWNNDITYLVGQYCIYDNKLWKCLVQHSGQAPSEGTYWTQTSVDEEIVNVNSSLNEVKNVVMFHNAGSHNAIYRAKNLGSSLTASQKAQISAGTFKDMYIGDYWVINGITWRIAHFDYWLHCGDAECTKHHIVVVPDSNLYTAKMNDTNITTGGYVGSKMYTENLAEAKTTIRNAFGTANILTHRELLTNTTSGNRATNWYWHDSDIELMNESMVYGSPVGSKAVDDSINFNVGIDKSQLALFALDPSRITNRAAWWLRCVVSSAYFAVADNNGSAYRYSASYALGVRPAFGITAE